MPDAENGRLNMRLIDADKLEYRVMTECNPFGKPTLEFESGIKVMGMIEDAPTIDDVQVVRCGECKWWDRNDILPFDETERHHCLNCDGYWYKDEFCSDGKRKDGEHDV